MPHGRNGQGNSGNFKKGSYTGPGNKEVALSEAMDFAVKNSQLITPEMEGSWRKTAGGALKQGKNQNPLLRSPMRPPWQRHAAWCREASQSCLFKLRLSRKPGEVLDGSSAQEESIARATGLYPCIAQFNVIRNQPQVSFCPVYRSHDLLAAGAGIRDDRDQLLEQPFFVSIITAPAVNAGVVKSREPHNIPRIEEVMVTRIGKILAVAAVYRYDALVLGAYGCGVFQNNPTDVAGYFARFLGPGGRFENVFRHVTFAVPEKGRSKHNHHVFKEVLSF